MEYPIQVRQAREDDLPEIVDLYMNYQDFRRAFGSRCEDGAKAIVTDMSQMNMYGLFVAEKGEEIVGSIQLIHDYEKYAELERRSSPQIFLKQLGLIRGVWALTCLILGTRATPRIVDQDTCFVNLVIVSPDGKGIPAAVCLLLHACNYTRTEGKRYLAGWISTANHRSIDFLFAFFEGVEVRETRRSILSRLLLGVRSWTLLRVDVNSAVIKPHVSI